jgi:hypothetical protein
MQFSALRGDMAGDFGGADAFRREALTGAIVHDPAQILRQRGAGWRLVSGGSAAMLQPLCSATSSTPLALRVRRRVGKYVLLGVESCHVSLHRMAVRRGRR